MIDPIADMLTRIRNAYLAHKQTVDVPHSKMKLSLAKKLEELSYIESFAHDEANQVLTLKLRYKNTKPVLSKITRISKPGRRIYLRSNRLTSTLSGHGSKIISTSQGIMTDKEARKTGVGGEVICEVW